MKPVITGSRYVLAVNDLQKSADYYVNKLGFQRLWEDGEWQFLSRDNIRIMLGECQNERSAHENGDHSYFAYMEVQNINALYKEFQERNVEQLNSIEDKPWGQREFSLKTIDGHRLTFGEAEQEIS